MKTRTSAPQGRSQRDELEQLQSELREARRQRAVLPGEIAELASRVEKLEQELLWLRRTLEVAHGEASRPASALPDQLVLPFLVYPPRQIPYKRASFTLLLMMMLTPFLYLAPGMRFATRLSLMIELMLMYGLILIPILQEAEDDASAPLWRFDEEGLAQVGPGASGGKILYREIHHVETGPESFKQPSGQGSMGITWLPEAITSLGQPVTFPLRRIELEQLDDPLRLADWLRDRVQQARDERKAEPHVS